MPEPRPCRPSRLHPGHGHSRCPPPGTACSGHCCSGSHRPGWPYPGRRRPGWAHPRRERYGWPGLGRRARPRRCRPAVSAAGVGRGGVAGRWLLAGGGRPASGRPERPVAVWGGGRRPVSGRLPQVCAARRARLTGRLLPRRLGRERHPGRYREVTGRPGQPAQSRLPADSSSSLTRSHKSSVGAAWMGSAAAAGAGSGSAGRRDGQPLRPGRRSPRLARSVSSWPRPGGPAWAGWAVPARGAAGGHRRLRSPGYRARPGLRLEAGQRRSGWRPGCGRPG